MSTPAPCAGAAGHVNVSFGSPIEVLPSEDAQSVAAGVYSPSWSASSSCEDDAEACGVTQGSLVVQLAQSTLLAARGASCVGSSSAAHDPTVSLALPEIMAHTGFLLGLKQLGQPHLAAIRVSLPLPASATASHMRVSSAFVGNSSFLLSPSAGSSFTNDSSRAARNSAESPPLSPLLSSPYRLSPASPLEDASPATRQRVRARPGWKRRSAIRRAQSVSFESRKLPPSASKVLLLETVDENEDRSNADGSNATSSDISLSISLCGVGSACGSGSFVSGDRLAVQLSASIPPLSPINGSTTPRPGTSCGSDTLASFDVTQASTPDAVRMRASGMPGSSVRRHAPQSRLPGSLVGRGGGKVLSSQQQVYHHASRPSISLTVPELLELLHTGLSLLHAHVPDLPASRLAHVAGEIDALGASASAGPSASAASISGSKSVFAPLWPGKGLYRDTELRIMSFLDVVDVVMTVSLVSQAWMLMSHNALLWRGLTLERFSPRPSADDEDDGGVGSLYYRHVGPPACDRASGSSASSAAAMMSVPWELMYRDCHYTHVAARRFALDLHHELLHSADGPPVTHAAATSSGNGLVVETAMMRMVVEWLPLALGDLNPALAETEIKCALWRFLMTSHMRADVATLEFWQSLEVLPKDAMRHLLHCLAPEECSYALARAQDAYCEHTQLLNLEQTDRFGSRFMELFGGVARSKYFTNGEWDHYSSSFCPLLYVERGYALDVDSGVLCIGPQGIGLWWFAWKKPQDYDSDEEFPYSDS